MGRPSNSPVSSPGIPPGRTVARFQAAYLVAHCLGGLAWWFTLYAWPRFRPAFMAAGAPESTLMAFAVPDLMLYAGGSLVAGHALWTGRPWSFPAACVHAGAAAYAALYCLGLWWLDPQAWLPALLMFPSLFIPPWIAWSSRP